MASRSMLVNVREFSTNRMRWGSGAIGGLSKQACGRAAMGERLMVICKEYRADAGEL
ncbi:hypothetical protein D3C81_955720 [compost metagenome]